jgi:hypothetical protein
MHALVNNTLGRIHHAAGHPALPKNRPTYAFIPEEFFGETGLNRGRYLVSRWPVINCSANPDTIRSQVIPDPEKPADLRSRCPILREFLRRLERLTAGKPTPAVAAWSA